MPVSSPRLRWGFVALLAAAVAGLVFATQPRPQYEDAAGFTVMGRGLLSGQAPFSGLFDDKPPGIYLIGALAWVLDPGDVTVSMQSLSVVAIAAAATACGWLVSVAGSRFWVGVAAAVVTAAGLSLPALSAGGGLSELFGVAGMAVSVAAVVGMLAGRKGIGWPIGAGAALAWAVGSSLLTLGALPALAALWLTLPIDDTPAPLARSSWTSWSRRRAFDKRLAAAVAGAGVVSLVVWWPVLSTGVAAAAADAFVRYNGLYRDTGILRPRAWVNGFGLFWPLWLPTLVLFCVPTAGRRLLGLALVRSNLARAMALWVFAVLALLVLGRRFYPHYLLLLVPPLAVLLGMALTTAVEGLPFWRPRLSSRAVGLGLCLVIGAGLISESLPAAPTDTQIAANAALASYIRANSAASDTIYVWGFDPELYLMADRDPSGPYFVVVPLIMPGYDRQAVATMLDVWQAHPPRLVVTANSPAADLIRLDPLVVPADLTNRGEPADYPALDPLRSFIKAHYTLAATLQTGEVWRYAG
ncbi:MAG: hypothetical protein ACHQ01_00925 [Candidatus Limnocylindrales bacterium]